MLFPGYLFQYLVIGKGETKCFLDPIQNFCLYRYYHFRWRQKAVETLVINELTQTDGGLHEAIYNIWCAAAKLPGREGTRLKMFWNLHKLKKCSFCVETKVYWKGGERQSCSRVAAVPGGLGRDTQGWEGPQDLGIASGKRIREHGNKWSVSLIPYLQWGEMFLKGGIKFWLLLSLLGLFSCVF